MNLKHGLSGTKLYNRWASMLGRCLYPSHTSWKWYGAKGVTVAQRWHDFAAFLADMGNPPFRNATIERRDSAGPYSPENCYWATPKQQARNNSHNLLLTFKGRTQSAAAWGEELNIPADRIHCRKERGWTDERALTEPPRKTSHTRF